MHDDGKDRIVAIISDENLARARSLIAQHLFEGGRPDAVLSLEDPSEAERRSISTLLRIRASRTDRVRIPLRRLHAVLGLPVDDVGLIRIIEEIDGPSPADVAKGFDSNASRPRVVRLPDTLPAGTPNGQRKSPLRVVVDRIDNTYPQLQGWANDLVRSGRLAQITFSNNKSDRNQDVATAVTLLEQTERLLQHLPLSKPLRVESLATKVLGNPTALSDTPLTAVLLDLARTIGGPATLDGEAGLAETWASIGLLTDDLRDRVCVLNMPTTGTSRVDHILQAAGHEPVWLTLRALITNPPTLTNNPVYVCQSPSFLLTAAESLGSQSATIVATEGASNVSLLRLLDQLADAGAKLHFRGGFTWQGVKDTMGFLSRFGDSGTVWKMDAETYRSGLSRLGARPQPLADTRYATPWDPSLARVMSSHGFRVPDALVAHHLIPDIMNMQERVAVSTEQATRS